MGQVLQKSGEEEKKVKEIGPIIERCYDKFFRKTENWSEADFYHAVCLTVEEINATVGSTEFRVPSTEALKRAYDRHHNEGKPLEKEEFEKILREIMSDTGVTGFGAKEMLFYIFGVPVTTLLAKQQIIPKAIPNEIFIPIVTSVTVFALAKFNKI